MRLVVQARSWEGVCVPGGLAAAPLGAEARAHGHSWLARLIGSHCGVRLWRGKRCGVRTALCKPAPQHHAFFHVDRADNSASLGNGCWQWKKHWLLFWLRWKLSPRITVLPGLPSTEPHWHWLLQNHFPPSYNVQLRPLEMSNTLVRTATTLPSTT